MKHGLADTLKEEIILKLRILPFSLNIDEATSDHGKKILTMLVNFFDTTSGEQKCIVVIFKNARFNTNQF